ncbi:ATP-binding protein [Haloarcula litorea]|uniref:receiver/sensor box histidine kinase n=1 Tax=Haloarcula litorea TaxID=3032579 RepID=UPI0023E86C27|nr:ATP-binding protein [Halomicroarcula sp. GDY20]
MATRPLRVLYVSVTADGCVPASLAGLDDVEATAVEAGALADAIDPSTVDCVVAPASLPDCDGVTLYERFVAGTGVPYVLLADDGDERLAADALNAGVDGYVAAEATDDRLAEVVRDRAGASEESRVDAIDWALLSSFPDPAVVASVDGGDPTIRRANEAFETLFGYDAASVVGTGVSDLLVPSDDHSTATAMAEAVARGETVGREVERETADGDRRTFLFRGLPVRGGGEATLAVGFYLDITDRTAHHDQMTALHETARRLMQSSSTDEVLSTGLAAARDVLDHEINAIHRYDADAGGLVPVATTDRTEAVLGDPPTFPAGDSIAWRAYERGEPILRDDVRDDPDVLNPSTPIRSEMVLPLADYGVLVAASTARNGFDEGDLSLGRVLATTVESALAQVEREETLRAREQSLARQNERLDEFASIVSHDLRTPLDLANVHLELVREGQGDTEEHIERVEAAHARMTDIIDDVLTWARDGDEITDTERVPLATLIENSWDTVADGDATLDVTTTRTVDCDPDRLRRVFENLFRNAVAHGGEAPTIRVGDTTDEPGVYVADDGPGIPQARRDDVFDSGVSTAEDGTGLGLAIVEQIVEAHGWEIRAGESEQGGARFEIVGLAG